MFTVPKNTMLYRAAIIVEKQPVPRQCSDTGKIGVYFSMNHPYLSETMCVENQTDLPVAVYQTKEPITVVKGKYTAAQGSHVDFEVEPVYDTTAIPVGAPYDNHAWGELFLTGEELPKIEYMGCYFVTFNDAFQRWNAPVEN